jgi:hypothetical protein
MILSRAEDRGIAVSLSLVNERDVFASPYVSSLVGHDPECLLKRPSEYLPPLQCERWPHPELSRRLTNRLEPDSTTFDP